MAKKVHQGPPPGYISLQAVCKALEIGRASFYESGLADLLDSWQVSPNTPRLYAREDVGKLRYWLLVRKGQIALGTISAKYPLKPGFDLDAWFEEDEQGVECPQCSESAVIDWDTERVWCPYCGIVEPNSKS